MATASNLRINDSIFIIAIYSQFSHIPSQSINSKPHKLTHNHAKILFAFEKSLNPLVTPGLHQVDDDPEPIAHEFNIYFNDVPAELLLKNGLLPDLETVAYPSFPWFKALVALVQSL